MQGRFNEAHYFDNKVKYVPLRGDDDPLWDYVANRVYMTQPSWSMKEWEKELSKLMNSELTVSEYLKEL